MNGVSILGSGNMIRGIATRALAGGNTVQILDRDADKAAALARQLTGRVTTGRIGDPVGEDRRLTNPVDFATFDSLVTPADSSAAEEMRGRGAELGSSNTPASCT